MKFNNLVSFVLLGLGLLRKSVKCSHLSCRNVENSKGFTNFQAKLYAQSVKGSLCNIENANNMEKAVV